GVAASRASEPPTYVWAPGIAAVARRRADSAECPSWNRPTSYSTCTSEVLASADHRTAGGRARTCGRGETAAITRAVASRAAAGDVLRTTTSAVSCDADGR